MRLSTPNSLIVTFAITFSIVILTHQTALIRNGLCASGSIDLLPTGSEFAASSTNVFPYTFTTPFPNIPSIAIGCGGYSSLDVLFNELWALRFNHNNNTGFDFILRIETNTRISSYRAVFLAIDSSLLPGLFKIYNLEYAQSQLVNTSSGTGSRTDTFLQTPSPATTFHNSSFIHHMTNVLHLRSTSTLGFTVACSFNVQVDSSTGLTFSNSFRVSITWTGDGRTEKMGISIIIVNPSIIQADNYYQVHAGSILVTASSALNQYDLILDSSSTSVATISAASVFNTFFLMGFSKWDAQASNGALFSWNLATDASAQPYLRVSNSGNITRILFNFLIFGKVDCTLWSISNQSCVSLCGATETNGIAQPICRPCNSVCNTCQDTPTQCSSCVSGKYLRNSTCLTCDASLNLVECGYVPPANTTDNINSSPPIWLLVLAIIPILGVGLYCYCRYKKAHSTILAEKVPSFREHPSIQF